MRSVSVVIPTYNRKRLLRRALQSVFKQTRSPDEVIVVDDGSTDGTDAMVASEFPNALYVSQTRRGVSSARNHGIRLSSSDWLAFLDSDDEWLPDKLRRQGEILSRSASVRVCHCDEIWIRNGIRVNPKERHRKHGGQIYHHCLPLCAISPSSVVIHRDVFNALGGFDEDLPVCEDYDMWLRVSNAYFVAYIDEPLVVKYGGHSDQLSKAFAAMDRYRITSLRKMLDSGCLLPEYRLSTLETILEKLSIYCTGASKRKRVEEVAELKILADRCASEYEHLSFSA